MVPNVSVWSIFYSKLGPRVTWGTLALPFDLKDFLVIWWLAFQTHIIKGICEGNFGNQGQVRAQFKVHFLKHCGQVHLVGVESKT